MPYEIPKTPIDNLPILEGKYTPIDDGGELQKLRHPYVEYEKGRRGEHDSIFVKNDNPEITIYDQVYIVKTKSDDGTVGWLLRPNILDCPYGQFFQADELVVAIKTALRWGQRWCT